MEGHISCAERAAWAMDTTGMQSNKKRMIQNRRISDFMIVPVAQLI
jgi:hypothetical protein